MLWEPWSAVVGGLAVVTYLHLSASISLPGVSRQRRISTACWRTTVKASSSSRAWSSTGGGDVEPSRLAAAVRRR